MKMKFYSSDFIIMVKGVACLSPNHIGPAKVINVTADNVDMHLANDIPNGRNIKLVDSKVLFDMLGNNIYFFQ